MRKGKKIDKLNKLGQKETDYEEQMRAGGIPEWFIESCNKISYLLPPCPCGGLCNDGVSHCLV